MRIIFVTILGLLAYVGNGQDSFRADYNLIKNNVHLPFETLRIHSGRHFYEDSFFIDHIVKKYSGAEGLSRFISNRYYLEKFITSIGNSSSARMEMDGKEHIQIDISVVELKRNELGKIEFDSTDFEGKKTEFDFKYIKSVNSKSVFGFVWDTSIVTRISKFQIAIDEKFYEIDSFLVNDLFFPSLCETSYALKPIEAYFSPNKKYVYIYISGGQFAAKYFCKIIFDLQTRKSIGRMIADVRELSEYRCLYYDKFIGF